MKAKESSSRATWLGIQESLIRVDISVSYGPLDYTRTDAIKCGQPVKASRREYRQQRYPGVSSKKSLEVRKNLVDELGTDGRCDGLAPRG